MTEQEMKEIREQIDFWYDTMAITFRQLGVYDLLFDAVERFKSFFEKEFDHNRHLVEENDRLRKALDEIRRGRLYDRLKMQEIAREALEE